MSAHHPSPLAGVQLGGGERVEADLVVVASGRHSRLPQVLDSCRCSSVRRWYPAAISSPARAVPQSTSAHGTLHASCCTTAPTQYPHALLYMQWLSEHGCAAPPMHRNLN